MALAPELLAALKRRAADQGKTLQDVANELLRQGLTARQAKPTYRLKLRGWDAEQLPGVDIADREKLFDVMERHSS